MLVAGFAGRFPAALVLNTGLLVCGDTEPCCEVVTAGRLFPALAAVATRPAAVPVVVDCELAFRIITGLLFDAAVLATILLPVTVGPFPPLTGEACGGGRSSLLGADGSGAALAFPSTGGRGPVVAGGAGAAAVDGRGGGAASEAVTVVLVDDLTSRCSGDFSSPEVRGDANRAVGRRPDPAEPPDFFFKMGCGGGGLEEEGVTDFLPSTGAEPCPEGWL